MTTPAAVPLGQLLACGTITSVLKLAARHVGLFPDLVSIVCRNINCRNKNGLFSRHNQCR